MLILVRHGRTEANAAGRLLGRSDPVLDEVGRAQAAALRGAVAGAARVVSSPLRRARETAEAFGLPIAVDDRWVELDYGELEGHPLAEMPPATWAAWRADPDFAPPGGESHTQLGTRVRSACEAVAEEAVDSDIVVVSHVGPLKAAVAWALGVGDVLGFRLQVSPASITRVALRRTGAVLLSFNEVAHLPPG